VWTGVSVIVLLAGVAAMSWWYAARSIDEEEEDEELVRSRTEDPLALWQDADARERGSGPAADGSRSGVAASACP